MAINYTAEQLLKLGEPAPEWQEALKTFPALGVVPKPLAKDAIYGMRENQAKTRKPLSPIPPHVKVVDQTIPMRDRAEIPIRIYSPANHNGKRSPLIVNCHGGGYMLGGLWMGHEFGINVVTLFNAVLVDVGYRMCPEYPFPTPVNDSWDALKWAADNATSLNANPELGFIMAGVSAGANLSAVLSLLARDSNLTPPLTGAFLSALPAFHNDSVPEKYKSRWLSLEQNGVTDPILSRAMYDYIKELYKPDPTSPLFAPILHPKGFKGLPRTYLAVCGMDAIRDDAILYDEALREDEVETRMDVYAGFPHCWWGFLPQLEASKRYEKDSLEGVKWLLRKD